MCLKFIGSEFPERSKDFYAVLSIDNSTVTIKIFCIVCLEAIAGLDEDDSKILYSLCEIFFFLFCVFVNTYHVYVVAIRLIIFSLF